MKRFRFPLQPVAVLRAHQEVKAREAFGVAVQELTAAETTLSSVRTRTRAFETALFDGRRGTFNATAEADALLAYRGEVAAERQAESRSQECHRALEERRQEFLAAHRRLEIVRRLETKARQAHRLEANREEQAEFDDFAGRRAASRNQLIPS